MRRNASIEGFVKESIPIIGLILILQKSTCQSQDLSQFLPQPEDFPNMCANCRTYHKTSCLSLRTFWGVCTNRRIYCGCVSADDLRTQTPAWGHYQGRLVTWPGCCESHADFVIPQCFQRASWAHNLLEVGPKGRANGHDGRLLRLKFNTNKCKYMFKLVLSTWWACNCWLPQ